MSKISLSPDASGTGIFTIASPNSNTNRTLTLPDDTGTIVTNSGNQAGSFTTLNTSGAVVFNDAGADVDFRVEGDADANLLFVDASTDRVGVGTNAPSSRLHLSSATSSTYLQITNTSASPGNVFLGTESGLNYLISRDNGSGNQPLAILTGTSERLRITSAGDVGIGTTDPSGFLGSKKIVVGSGSGNAGMTVYSGTTQAGYFAFGDGASGAATYAGLVEYDHNGNSMRLYTASTERMRIDSSGRLLINNTSAPTAYTEAKLKIGTATGVNTQYAIAFDKAGGYGESYIGNYYTNVPDYGLAFTVGATNNVMKYNSSGNLTVPGALSKGSGSFKIDHPLKSETNYLVHSFVEAPQADNIYRGKVELVAGRAEVNIDTVANMTEGTFVALNREVQCFTSNESDWDAVRGSVTGNILTIECKNAESTATISWLVIGERQDQHMYDTDWTDENGKVIVEPLKSVEEVVEPTGNAEDTALETGA